VSELLEVLDAVRSFRDAGEALALATIVDVRGSTYRRPGARLVVTRRGDLVGNLSGGCLEGEVADVARAVMEDGRPRLASFDLTADDEAVWGWGLGCNGAFEVFVEPAEPAAAVGEAIRSAMEAERPLAIVTVIESADDGVPAGARVLVGTEGSAEGSLGNRDADGSAASAAREALAAGRSEIRALPSPAGGMRAFVEVVEPPLRLLVCGAGHDAIPLVRFAASLGWRVDVVDDRDAFLASERFPEARAFVYVERPEEAARASGADARTYVVVMTHNYLRDRGYLRAFLESDVAYLGMLGPRRRLERLLGDLRDEGVLAAGEPPDRLHGPAGLDVGAEGPEEIAWAIVGEVLAVRRGRAGGFLRDRSSPIHQR